MYLVGSFNDTFLFGFLLTCIATTGTAGKHWKYERVVTVGLVALIPTAFIYPNALVDYGLAVAIPLHGHWYVPFDP